MDIPIELFLGGMGISITLAIFGFLRQPQIPAMLCFGGMFMLVFAVATDNIIMDSFASGNVDNTYYYNIESSTGPNSISGLTNPQVRGENVFSTSSQLYGKTIDCIDVFMKKSGTPTQTYIVGIFDRDQADSDPLLQSFGTGDASLLSTDFQWRTFCLPAGQTYTLGLQDVIGVKYTEASATNVVQISTTLDSFDSTTTFHVSQSSSTFLWSSFTTLDTTLRIYLTGDGLQITQDPYAFTELPKTLFALMGSIFMLCGALMVLRNN